MFQSQTEQSSTVSSQETTEVAAPKLNPEFKAKWLAALRSGEYQQCRDDLTDGTGFCCIGVGFLQMEGRDIDDVMDEEDPTDAAVNTIGLSYDINRKLVQMNDDEKRSFPEIADFIEANL